jgi:hypothetical protein
LTGAIGRQVRVDSPRLSMISVSAHNISIADDPAFSTEPFVTAQFPFALAAALPGGGTTADPKFVPNVKAIAGNAAKQAITGKVAEGRAERKVARRQN